MTCSVHRGGDRRGVAEWAVVVEPVILLQRRSAHAADTARPGAPRGDHHVPAVGERGGQPQAQEDHHHPEAEEVRVGEQRGGGWGGLRGLRRSDGRSDLVQQVPAADEAAEAQQQSVVVEQEEESVEVRRGGGLAGEARPAQQHGADEADRLEEQFRGAQGAGAECVEQGPRRQGRDPARGGELLWRPGRGQSVQVPAVDGSSQGARASQSHGIQPPQSSGHGLRQDTQALLVSVQYILYECFCYFYNICFSTRCCARFRYVT